MLNKKTREILNQLSTINNSMIITYPVTTVILGKSIQAFLNVEELGETDFQEIGVFNIGEFNSVVSVIDDPEISNDGTGTLTIKNDNSSIKYGTTTVDIIESECRGNPELVDKIARNENVISFSLGLKDLDKIKKMSGLLKDLNNLDIKSVDGKITVTTRSNEKSSNDFVINFDGESTGDNSITLDMSLVNKLPSSDFNVKVYKSAKGTLVSVFESTTVPGLKVVVSAKAI